MLFFGDIVSGVLPESSDEGKIKILRKLIQNARKNGEITVHRITTRVKKKLLEKDRVYLSEQTDLKPGDELRFINQFRPITDFESIKIAFTKGRRQSGEETYETPLKSLNIVRDDFRIVSDIINGDGRDFSPQSLLQYLVDYAEPTEEEGEESEYEEEDDFEYDGGGGDAAAADDDGDDDGDDHGGEQVTNLSPEQRHSSDSGSSDDFLAMINGAEASNFLVGLGRKSHF